MSELVVPDAVSPAANPSELWEGASKAERGQMILDAVVRLAYSLPGLKLYDIEEGEIYWSKPDDQGAVTIPHPGRRCATIYQWPGLPQLSGLQIENTSPQTGSEDKAA